MALVAAAPLAPAHAQDGALFYSGDVAKKLGVCPFIRLTIFNINKSYVQGEGMRRDYTLTWSNNGKKGVVALEVRLLKFNPFNERLGDSAFIFPGHRGVNLPLEPTESGSGRIRASFDKELFTALAYVSKIRFTDGMVWRASPAAVAAQIKVAVPSLAGDKPSRALKAVPKN